MSEALRPPTRRQGVSRGGLIEITSPGGKVEYIRTFTCCHCNSIFEIPDPNAPEFGFCGRCHARECIGCAKKLNGRCMPFEKKLERYEARAALFRSLEG